MCIRDSHVTAWRGGCGARSHAHAKFASRQTRRHLILRRVPYSRKRFCKQQEDEGCFRRQAELRRVARAPNDDSRKGHANKYACLASMLQETILLGHAQYLQSKARIRANVKKESSKLGHLCWQGHTPSPFPIRVNTPHIGETKGRSSHSLKFSSTEFSSSL